MTRSSYGSRVELQTHEKQEEQETDIGEGLENGGAFLGEDSVEECVASTNCRRSQYNSSLQGRGHISISCMLNKEKRKSVCGGGELTMISAMTRG